MDNLVVQFCSLFSSHFSYSDWYILLSYPMSI